MKRVYLDQNKWIDLMRAKHGRKSGERFVDALTIARAGVDNRLISSPLSLTHYALEPDTNPHARGAADLTVGMKPTSHLDGDYWMELGRKGRISTSGHTRAIFDTFEGAQQGRYE
jgi:hypothetical protein